MVPGLIGLGGMGTPNVVFWDVDAPLRTPRWMDTAPPSILPFASLVFRCRELEEHARRLEIPGGLRRVRRACEDIGLAINDDLLQQLREVKRRHQRHGQRGQRRLEPGVTRLLNALMQGESRTDRGPPVAERRGGSA